MGILCGWAVIAALFAIILNILIMSLASDPGADDNTPPYLSASAVYDALRNAVRLYTTTTTTIFAPDLRAVESHLAKSGILGTIGEGIYAGQGALVAQSGEANGKT